MGSRLARLAREYGTFMHQGMTYGGQPYEVHLEAVERILLDAGYSHDLWRAAAWLHDVIEDCGISRERLADEFDSDVLADIVWRVSCDPTLPSRAAKMESIYAKTDARSAILKVADRIANLEASERGSRHADRYMREAAEFHRRVAVLVVNRRLRDRLEAAYDRLENFQGAE